MSEIIAKELPVPVLAKQEMDRSYEREEESGFQSSFASVSRTDSEDSWMMVKGEILDPLIFDPPIQSSNIKSAMQCDISAISTISGDEPHFKG